MNGMKAYVLQLLIFVSRCRMMISFQLCGMLIKLYVWDCLLVMLMFHTLIELNMKFDQKQNGWFTIIVMRILSA